MRIAIANWSRRVAGGVETYLAEVMPALAKLGHELALITELDEPAERTAIGDGVSFELCTGSIGMSAALEALTDWRPDVIYLHQMQELELERRLSEIAPVVAFGHAYYGTCISGTKTHRFPFAHPCSRQLGPGCLVHYFPNRCGGLNPVTMVRLYNEQGARLEQMRRYFRVVTFSDHMAREYAKHGVPATRLWDEGNLSGGEPLVARRTAPSAGGSWNLMFLGRFELLKGADVLIDSLSHLASKGSRKLALKLIGDGSERRRLERKAAVIMAETKQLSIEFPGWLTGDELEREWDLAHALVMPSIWPEPFGLAGIEAGKRGLPVLAFEVGAIPEWLEHGTNGLLAPLGGSRALNMARALESLMSDPSVYASMSEAAPRMAERFSLQHHLEPLCAVLQLAAASAGRKAS